MAVGVPLSVEAMRLDDIAAGARDRAAELQHPVAGLRLRAGADRQPPGALRRGAGRRRSAWSGFAGVWLMVDEAHITTFGVHPEWRRQGIGRRLLLRLLELAIELGARRMTLEVRVSNRAAQALYRAYGFEVVGRRAALLHR